MAMDVLITVGADVSAASGQLGQLGTSTATAMSTLATGIGQVSAQLSQMANKVSESLGATVSTFADFDQAMQNVKSIATGTNEQFEQMDALAVELASTMPTTSKAVAEGMFQLASAGLNANEIMQITPDVMNLAAASASSFEVAANGVTAALSAYGLELDDSTRVTEIFQNANVRFKTTMPELAESLKTVGATANAMGITLEDTAASIGLARNAGLDASSAATGLRNVFLALASPTDQARARMEAIGFELKKNADGTLNLEGTFVDLKGALNGIQDPLERAAALEEIFTKRGLSAAAALADNADGFNALAQSLAAEGSVAEAVAIQNEGLANQMAILNGSIEEQQKALGEKLAPAQLKALELKLKMLEVTNKLPDAFVTWGGGVLLVGAELAKMILPLISAIAQTVLLTTAIGAQTGARAAATGTTAAHTGATGSYTLSQMAANLAASLFPFILIVVGIAAIIAGIILLVKNWDTVTAVMEDLWKFMSAQFKPAIDTLTGGLGGLKDMWEENSKAIKLLLLVFVPFIGIPILIFDNWSVIGPFFAGLFGNIADGARTLGAGLIDTFTNIVEPILEPFLTIGSQIAEAFADIIAAAFTWGANIVENIGAGIADTIGDIAAPVTGLLNSIGGALGFNSPTNPQMQERGALLVENLARGIADAADAVKGSAGGIISGTAGTAAAGGGGGATSVTLQFGDINLPSGSTRQQLDALIDLIRSEGSRTGLLDVA